MVQEKNVGAFNRDVAERDGYSYTDPDRLSSRLSNERLTEVTLALGDLTGKRVVDVGCGDGTYSARLLEGGAREVLGVDAAEAAIERARRLYGDRPGLSFEALDVYALSPEPRFDVAVVRGILHHLYDAERAIERICAAADEVVVLEPNGYNPILKLIEKLSPYHREHEEKSYSPRKLDRWFERQGARVEESTYVGLVPFFCPDLLARVCKACEPLIERTPLARSLFCAQYVQRIRTR